MGVRTAAMMTGSFNAQLHISGNAISLSIDESSFPVQVAKRLKMKRVNRTGREYCRRHSGEQIIWIYRSDQYRWKLTSIFTDVATALPSNCPGLHLKYFSTK